MAVPSGRTCTANQDRLHRIGSHLSGGVLLQKTFNYGKELTEYMDWRLWAGREATEKVAPA